jgi:copper chaperone
VERALDELTGIQSRSVDLEGKTVSVAYDEAKVSTEDIKNAIEDIGFDVE